MWAYREDPSELTDFVSQVRNLVYYNKYFLRMEYDDGYISRYLETIQAQESDANAMKKYMILMGVAMIATAPLTGGTTAIWGFDMIISTTTGKSMFDHILHSAMEAVGVDENYIGNFSIWGITSNQGWNLILTEALSGGISFGVGLAAKAAARAGLRAGSRLVARFPGLEGAFTRVKEVGRSVLRALSYTDEIIDNVLSFGYRSALKELSTISLRKLVLKGVKEYFELVGEVIFEMAFDSVLRFDKSERPAGGGEAFFTAMTLSILTSGLMRAMGRRGITAIRTDSDVMYKAHKARLILPTTALALQMAMTLMRVPVIIGNIQ